MMAALGSQIAPFQFESLPETAIFAITVPKGAVMTTLDDVVNASFVH
jgi:hypothetical protein